MPRKRSVILVALLMANLGVPGAIRSGLDAFVESGVIGCA